MTDTRDVAETDAINLAHALFRRLNDIETFALTTATELRSEILASATLHIRNLRSRRDDATTEGSARVVCRALFGENTEPPAEFWATNLGRDVAWAIGYPLDTATVSAAVAVLGTSRSYVHRIIRDKILTADEAWNVTAASLKDYVRRPAAYNRGGIRN